MDGKRIQEYLSKEAKALLTVYRQFQTLLPADNEDAASHKGEDGRYIESLISEYLKRYLPKDLEVLTGFILRPAVKTGINNRARKKMRILILRSWTLLCTIVATIQFFKDLEIM